MPSQSESLKCWTSGGGARSASVGRVSRPLTPARSGQTRSTTRPLPPPLRIGPVDRGETPSGHAHHTSTPLTDQCPPPCDGPDRTSGRTLLRLLRLPHRSSLHRPTPRDDVEMSASGAARRRRSRLHSVLARMARGERSTGSRLSQNSMTVATAGQLDLLRNSIRDNQAKGAAIRGAHCQANAPHTFTVLAADAGHVVIKDCTVDDGISRDIATGAIVDDTVATYLFKATLVERSRRFGSWQTTKRLGEMAWRSPAASSRSSRWRKCRGSGSMQLLPTR